MIIRIESIHVVDTGDLSHANIGNAALFSHILSNSISSQTARLSFKMILTAILGLLPLLMEELNITKSSTTGEFF